MTRIHLTWLVLLILLAAGACGDEENGEQYRRMQRPAPSVEVVQTQEGSLPLEQKLTGIVRARNEVRIQPDISGRVREVHVEDGDTVEEGEPLVQLDDRQYRSRVRQAEASLEASRAAVESAQAELEEIEAELERNERLAEQTDDVISELELERLRARKKQAEARLRGARADVDSARSQLEEQKEQLTLTTITAPMTGIVGRRNVEQGMYVDPSRELFVIGNMNNAVVDVTLSDRMLAFIEEGQPARVFLQSTGNQPLNARVDQISPFLDDRSFSTRARLELLEVPENLRSGQYAEVEINYGHAREATLVANGALHEDPATNRIGVFLATDLTPDRLRDQTGGEPSETSLSDPVSIQFQEVNVIARGRAMTAVEGLEPNRFVVALGKDLLSLDEEVNARVRWMKTDTLLEMQKRQQEDLIQQFLEKQEQQRSRTE